MCNSLAITATRQPAPATAPFRFYFSPSRGPSHLQFHLQPWSRGTCDSQNGKGTPRGHKKLRTDPADYQPTPPAFNAYLSCGTVAAIRATHKGTTTTTTIISATLHIAPALWQQNVPQLPLRPHPHPHSRLTKPMMIPMTIFYSWQVATAQRRLTHPVSTVLCVLRPAKSRVLEPHPNPTNNQTLPPPSLRQRAGASRSPLSGSVSGSVSVSVSMSMSVSMSVPRCLRRRPFTPSHSPTRYHVSSFKVFSCNRPRALGAKGSGNAKRGRHGRQTVARNG